ncbi:hypothetical protein FQ775_12305 [Nitratireductor mangrovi]|uniref:DUF6456 domain-containing protein n=1 Tax=Nitratireductor mangrovi TaxID=2599600 RepID=A0A5B8KZK8_9HYPH|nr:DUF6456 domain-containing protein [Nitratireductor mangrovi]QDZ01095.1 hypothetical protein FQ775_12305 [Nitratireductor mangrovi]
MGRQKAGDDQRILRFLRPGPAELAPCGRASRIRLVNGGGDQISVEEEAVTNLVRAGLVERDAPDGLRLTAAGVARYDRLRAGSEAFHAQHATLADSETVVEGNRQSVCVNLSESPLAQLARRRGRDGSPFLSEAEILAGERLRADFTRGQLMPRMGANWDVTAVARSGRGAGGAVDLSDMALSARQCVNAACDAVGPELSGVLVDVCCFLKGLAQVEAERQWPARSAKIVLKAALAALARHYDPRPRRHCVRVRHHWGSADYRPSLSGLGQP